MESRQLLYTHILLALLASIITYVYTIPLVEAPSEVLITDAIASGTALSLLLFLLRNVFEYSHLSSLSIRQQIINYSVLALLFTLCWLGINFVIIYSVFTNRLFDIFIPLIPIRILISLFIFSLTFILSPKSLKDEIEENEINETSEQTSIDNDISTSIERITVKDGSKIEIIPVDDIIHIQAEGDYVMIHFTKGKILKEQTMKSFENSLPKDKFVRVHRSSIVNIAFISQIEFYNKQSLLLILKNGNQVKISLNGYKLLKQVLNL